MVVGVSYKLQFSDNYVGNMNAFVFTLAYTT